MAGVRLFHPTARGVTAIVNHWTRSLRRWNAALVKFEPAPIFCPACQTEHAVKTYHIAVDSSGFAMVSPTVWALMQRHDTGGFEVANEVERPPDQALALPELTSLRLLHGAANGQKQEEPTRHG